MLGQLLKGRYEIIAELGEGSFGQTFKAIDRDRFDELCVVKQLKPQYLNLQAQPQINQQVMTWFRREAAILKELGKHPQIPELLAYFNEANNLYIVQEFIDGYALTEEVQSGKPLNESQVTTLLQEILEVLAFVHEKRVIHRDLKPANMMRRRQDGKLILIDFGGVKELDGTIQLTLDGQIVNSLVICTRGYAPNEQLQGNPQLGSDVYAVGKVAIEALTGIHPYHLPENPETGEVIWRDRVQISDRLTAFLEKMVRDRYTQRYASAIVALQALQQTVIAPALPTFTFEVITVNERGQEISRRPGQAEYFVEDLGNGIALEMVKIPSGRFLMGSPEDEQEGYGDERPQHQVTVPGFFMGKFAVTQVQYQAIVSSNPAYFNPSYFKGEKRPVENVSWRDAIAFCDRLSRKTGRTYRLPSEAEWEYACRAGTTTPFHFGTTITTDLTNYDGNYTYASAPKRKYRQETTDAGSFPPNVFGLYDMHGNVWEWCQDVSHENYQGAPIDGSAWITVEEYDLRLLRGGSCFNNPDFCRSASRLSASSGDRNYHYGFRVVLVARIP